MNQTPIDLSFRLARAQDKARVLEMTAHTWSDGDYIAQVWDAWLADSPGELSVVESDGKLVAMAKLTALGPGEFWLEGLRVDADYRQHGIGQAMHHYQLALARRLGAQTVRYATGQDNVASHKIAADNGFRQVASFAAELQAQAEAAWPAPELLAPGDGPALQAALGRAVYVVRASGLYEQNWKWCALTEERLRAHLAAGQVMGFRQPDGLAAWAIVRPSGSASRRSA